MQGEALEPGKHVQEGDVVKTVQVHLATLKVADCQMLQVGKNF